MNSIKYYKNGLVAKWKNRRLEVIERKDKYCLVFKRLLSENDNIELLKADIHSTVFKNKLVVTQLFVSPESFEALYHAYKYLNSETYKLNKDTE